MTATTTETLHKKAHDAVSAALGDAYDCGRVWAAWSYGTMSEDDFSPVDENPDRISEITRAALDAVGFDAIVKERDALRDAVSAMHNFLNRNYRINGRNIELHCESHNQAWDDLHDTRFIVRSALALQESKP